MGNAIYKQILSIDLEIFEITLILKSELSVYNRFIKNVFNR